VNTFLKERIGETLTGFTAWARRGADQILVG
jgi:hypothetical protein